GFEDVRVRGEELLANAYGWTVRTLEGSAEIGRASCRERVECSVDGGSLQTNIKVARSRCGRGDIQRIRGASVGGCRRVCSASGGLVLAVRLTDTQSRLLRVRYDQSATYFFFFQAEDGIRDWSVTGVQTCALPISASRTSESAGRSCSRTHTAGPSAPWRGRPRSEERRVGKEWSARWMAAACKQTSRLRGVVAGAVTSSAYEVRVWGDVDVCAARAEGWC